MIATISRRSVRTFLAYRSLQILALAVLPVAGLAGCDSGGGGSRDGGGSGGKVGDGGGSGGRTGSGGSGGGFGSGGSDGGFGSGGSGGNGGNGGNGGTTGDAGSGGVIGSGGADASTDKPGSGGADASTDKPGSGGADASADKPGTGGADAAVDKPGSGGAMGTGGADAAVDKLGSGGAMDSGVDNPPSDAVIDASDGPGPSTSRRTIALAQGWRFIKMDVGGAAATAFDDSAWAPVTVPHTWNSSDGQDGGNDYYRGIGWYRTHVTVPAEEAGRRIYVEFDGANIVTTVWVNGALAGMHQGGFARFRFDVTSMIKTGAANVIAVQVSNAAGLSANIPPVTADFTFFGGLYRDIRLVTAEPAHLDLDHFGSSGVLATQSNVSRQTASVAVRASVTNAGAASFNATVAVKLLAADGSTVQMTSANATIAAGATSDVPLNLTVTNPHLWDGLKDPYLYRLQVDVKNGAQTLDTVVEPLGLRFFSFDANNGFSLNGNHLGLYGANKHQDRLNKGWAVLPADLDEDMAIVRDLGATALRLAHYQHAQHFYDLCDQNGIIVWAEVPVVNSVTSGTPFADNARQQLTELIRQSANHPAIVMWSLSNEVADGTPVVPLMTAMNTLAHQEDPSRPTTLATNFAPNGAITKTVDLLGINRYFGWYTGNYGQFAADVDSAHGLAGRPLAISEYGAGAGITIHTATPVNMDHSEEYQSLLHEAHWKAISARPFLWGSFLWNLFDFAVDSRNEGDTPGRNDKGLVTYDRKTKKDAFFYYKANWSSDPFVYITERRWSQRPVGTYQVKIYSNGDTANLTVNGVAQAAKTATDHIFIWTGIALHAGANTLAASATVNGKAVTDTVTVTGN